MHCFSFLLSSFFFLTFFSCNSRHLPSYYLNLMPINVIEATHMNKMKWITKCSSGLFSVARFPTGMHIFSDSEHLLCLATASPITFMGKVFCLLKHLRRNNTFWKAENLFWFWQLNSYPNMSWMTIHVELVWLTAVGLVKLKTWGGMIETVMHICFTMNYSLPKHPRDWNDGIKIPGAS